ncbi:MAG: DUF1684 domain-containing protein [Thermoplasmata archaeon]
MDLTERREALQQARVEKDRFFRGSHNSPVPENERGRFRGLGYFPYNPGLVFEVELQEIANPDEVIMATSVQGQESLYRRVGFFEFEVDGVSQKIYAYRRDDAHIHGPPSLFIPFRDGTSGKTTYGAGRYLDLEVSPSGSYILDFNEAYNPYCTYSPSYICPLPPRENWLTVDIAAGEKDYKAGH